MPNTPDLTPAPPPTLVALYQTRRDTLRQQLRQQPTLDAAAETLRRFVGALLVEYRQHEDDPRRLEAVAHLAEGISAATQMLLAASNATIWKAEFSSSTARTATPYTSATQRGLPYARIALTVGLGAWLYSFLTTPAQQTVAAVGFGLMALAQAIELSWPWLAKWFGRNTQAAAIAAAKRDPSRLSIEVDADTAVMKLRDVLLAADHAIDAIEQASTTPLLQAPSQRTLPAPMLDYLQELAAAHMSREAEYAALLAKQAAGQLLPLGITLLINFDGPNRAHFDAAPSLDAAQTQPRLVKPALMQGDVVLRRGEITLPAMR